MEESAKEGREHSKRTEKNDDGHDNDNKIDHSSESLDLFPPTARGIGKTKSRNKGFSCPVCKQKLFSHHDIKAHLKISHSRRR
ncbi:MAG: hypothetical protein M3162_02260 [Thermoproteota archaeon]|nr:hypothetical protein [Thermoproteota archaeon]